MSNNIFVNNYSYLIILSVVFLLSFPIKIKTTFFVDILKLSGNFSIQNNFIKISKQFVLRGNNIFIYNNKKSKKYKISSNDKKFIFYRNLLYSLFIRQLLNEATTHSNIGFKNECYITAVISLIVDTGFTYYLSKIKNNKQFVYINKKIMPKYNENIFENETKLKFSISVFDFFYALIMSVMKNKRKQYERKKI